MPWRASRALCALVLAAFAPAARGWIYPEHRDIALAGMAKLSLAERDALQRLWSAARGPFADRWCDAVAAGDQGLDPRCIDFAAWPALAGDHSCSPRQLAEAVVPGPWVLKVAAVAAKTKAELAKARERDDTLNAIARSNLALQRADPEYATRAGANNAHFLLPRSGASALEYLRSTIVEGAPLNALGLYVQYHLAAVAAASALAAAPPGDPSRAEQSRAVLALEGFALHWIEDPFAAGHVVGTWGAVAWRKGTHDYYNEFGLDTTDWTGRSIIVFGDANMKEADLDRASDAVTRSLRQVLAALASADRLAASARAFGGGPATVIAFDACKEERQPSARGAGEVDAEFWTGLAKTPVPGRGEGEVHPPRFRDELGPFAGGFASLSAGPAWGGVSPGVRGSGLVGVGVRIGYGLEGVTGSVGTGLAFVEGGLELSTAQVDNCGDSACSGLGSSTLFPRVPARTGLRLGLRLPFWVLPGDLVLLAPILAVASPRTLSNVGVEAASGGALPYERSLRTAAGIFQIVAGREVQATLYGYLGERTVPLVVVPVADPTSQYGVMALKSVAFSFPVVEWTPFRTFATQVAFSAQMQLGLGVELPLSKELRYPSGAATPDVPASWTVFFRIQSDGRYFFGSREDLQPPR